MKRYLLGMLVLASFGTMISSCSKDDKDTAVTPPVETDSIITISGDIAKNDTLKASKKYLLKGHVYVMSGATLTIEPGTVIMGDKTTKAALVVTRGGKINAAGTKEKPIVFTSAQAAGARREGDWGGLILLGNAKTNAATGEAKIEGGLVPTKTDNEGKAYIWYGGTNDDDNSGVLTYVRIEFAGIAFSPDNEINGLTMGGVGRGTKISYVQVYRSGDDAFEWFGGTVNCDHLVASLTWDDDFDTDNGFSGMIQFGVAQRYKTIADQSGSNGFESDNDANGSTNAPKTHAIFSNMTIIGPIQTGFATSGINANYQHGAQIRRNSAMNLCNSVIVGFQWGVYIDDTKGSRTSLNAADGSLVFSKNVIAGCTNVTKSEWATTDALAWAAWWGNTKTDTVTNVQDLGLVDAYKFPGAVSTATGTPSFLLKATSKAFTGADFDALTDAFWTKVTYRGAFNDKDDWTLGWTTAAAEDTKY
jgi:hypothetical protein